MAKVKMVYMVDWSMARVSSKFIHSLSKYILNTLWMSDLLLDSGNTEIIKNLQMVIAAMKLKDAYSLEGKLWPT